MSSFPTNILQQVQTYQRSSLGLLYNLCCFVQTANTKFKDFDKIQANLGSTVTFDTPPRFTTVAGLVAAFEPAAQLVETLTCDQAANTSFTVTAQQRIFNLEKGEESYMEVFGKSATAELANQIESNIAKEADSSVVSQLDGTTNTDSGPFRFFGDGVTQLTSYQQIAQENMLFRNFGSAQGILRHYLPDTVIPSVIGSGLNQFAPTRNNDIANSWELGTFNNAEYYVSNLLPLHVSGNSGVNGNLFTVVSTNDSTGQNVTQITATYNGTSGDANAVFSGDLFAFNDGVASRPNMRYLTYIGHNPSANKVQFRATANSAASGTTVVINIFPALNWAGGANQNLNNAIQAGMTFSGLPSHRAGMVVGGDALYVAMPQLPEQSPYDTANEYDPETHVSLRLTYGSLFGQNQTGMIYDCTWGSHVVPQYAMRTIIPLSQG